MQSVADIVESFRLKTGGLAAWPIYWTNAAGFYEGPFKGKGSPYQLQSALKEIVQRYDGPLRDEAELRYLMLRNGLGIDCSGFAYHVLSAYLSQQGLDLDEELIVYKTEISQALEKESWQGKLSAEEIDELPDILSLKETCERFDKHPAYITNVRRLCDTSTTTSVKNTSNILQADMLEIHNQYDDHIGIVTEVFKDKIRFVSSDFDPVGPGGICFHEIDIVKPDAGLEEQEWGWSEQLVAVKRLQVLV